MSDSQPPRVPPPEGQGPSVLAAANDRELLERLLASVGDQPTRDQAWSDLLKRWWGPLYAFARTLTRDQALAEDAVQESFVELWKAVTVKRQVIEHPKGWLFKLVSRKALNAIKSKRRRDMDRASEQEVQDLSMAKEKDEAVETERREAKEILFRLVNELPNNLRIAVVLHFGSGFSQMEIAEMTGCRQSTVSERLNEALGKLRQSLGRVGYSGLPAALPAFLGDALTSPPPSSIPAQLPDGIWKIGKQVSRRAPAPAAIGASQTAKVALAILVLGLAGSAAYVGLARTPAAPAAAPVTPQPEVKRAAKNTEPASVPAPAAPAALIPTPPAWKPFTDDTLTTYPPNSANWKLKLQGEDLTVTFQPGGGKPEAGLSYGYLGRNLSSSYELTGTIEYLGNEEHFACHAGICLSNRLNFGAVAWNMEKSASPVEFRTQAWLDEEGCRLMAMMKDAKGKTYRLPDNPYKIKPPWVQDGVQVFSDKPETPPGHVYLKMKEFGFGFAFSDHVRVSGLKIRPLRKENLISSPK